MAPERRPKRAASKRSKAGSEAGRTRKSKKDQLLDCRRMKALSHEQRVRIFAALAERVASPNELAMELDEGLSQISYHVQVLKEYGCIELVRTEPRRGAEEHFYRALEPTLLPPDAWDNLPPAARGAVSLHILQEFFDDVAASMKAGIFDDPPGVLDWTPVVLDSKGCADVEQLVLDFREAIAAVQAEASKRLRSSGRRSATAQCSATVFLATFRSVRDPRKGVKAFAAKRR
jgi:DNA-binding transcriptional ArsR family regulator